MMHSVGCIEFSGCNTGGEYVEPRLSSGSNDGRQRMRFIAPIGGVHMMTVVQLLDLYVAWHYTPSHPSSSPRMPPHSVVNIGGTI